MKTIFHKAVGYQKPLCQVVEVTLEGLLCASGVVLEEGQYNSTLDSFNQNTESYW